MNTLDKVVKQHSLKKPCSQCPFRKDRKGIRGLNKGRRTSIIDGLLSGDAGTFHCHKTIDYGFEGQSVMERKHCAGAMAATIKAGGMPQAASLAITMKLIGSDHYDEALPLSLDPEELEFDHE